MPLQARPKPSFTESRRFFETRGEIPYIKEKIGFFRRTFFSLYYGMPLPAEWMSKWFNSAIKIRPFLPPHFLIVGALGFAAWRRRGGSGDSKPIFSSPFFVPPDHCSSAIATEAAASSSLPPSPDIFAVVNERRGKRRRDSPTTNSLQDTPLSAPSFPPEKLVFFKKYTYILLNPSPSWSGC